MQEERKLIIDGKARLSENQIKIEDYKGKNRRMLKKNQSFVYKKLKKKN